MKEYEVYSEYMNGTKLGKVVRHNEHKYWGVHLSDSTSDKKDFLCGILQKVNTGAKT